MHNLPRQKLQEIVRQYGDEVISNTRKCRALLLDLCGPYKSEVFVLTIAQEEQIPEDLYQAPKNIPYQMLMAQLVKRLMHNRAINKEAAQWAVESWALALGIPIKSTGTESIVQPTPPLDSSPPSTPSPRKRAAPQFTSNFAMEVWGKSLSNTAQKWQKLGNTPGNVTVPNDYVLGLQPQSIPNHDFGAWVKGLQFHNKITWLNLEEISITDAGLQAISVLKALERLDIKNGQSLTDQGLSHLTHLTHLTHLDLRWIIQVTDTGIQNLQRLSNLRDLSLSQAGITDKAARSLVSLTTLEKLDLRKCKNLSDRGLLHFERLPKLELLVLQSCPQITYQGMAYLQRVSSLKNLNLANCRGIDNQALLYLRELPHLTFLNISGNPQIANQGIAYLQSHPTLSSLDLSQTGISDAGLRILATIPNLVYLDLSWCTHITDQGITNLQSLPQLAYLNLVGCPHITKNAIERLKTAHLSILS
ncbi:MAG: hypothetical protein JW981_10495 [Anaerolineae bacterium]|nr:hypothetical protein [Anaerolineae bacterium]